MKTISIKEKGYPPLLREISDPPEKFYIEGELTREDFAKSIAIVGTRNNSEYGKQAAMHFARLLAEQGFTIISGLARGIDAIAHASALEAGGRTIAVLGTGIDIIYPSENRALAKEIIKKGALISEFEPGTHAMPYHFPQRNRIVSGLSLGVIVIEAPEKSGSIITARLALEQNREVFCVPGSIFSKNSYSTNQFIKEGAKLVSTLDDILTELNFEVKKGGDTKQIPLLATDEEKKIYEILMVQREPMLVDEIIKLAHIPARTVNAALAMMELEGAVKHFGRGKYIIG